MTSPTSKRATSAEIQEFPHLLIGGERIAPSSGRRIASINPATGEVWAEVPEADERDIDKAVQAAREAFDGAWSKKTPSERGHLLRRFAELLSENIDRLAALDTKDNGKHIRDSAAEVTASVQWAHYFAGLADKIEGAYLPITGQNEFAYTIREPLGVVGAIVPWNSPTFVALGKLCPALAAGNTVVFKPAEGTPTGALLLGDLFEEAGFPPGTVNVVPGFGPTAGAALSKHPDVDKVSFTGEHLTAQIITQDSAPTLKRLQNECGGKSPQIIFADADLDAALSASATGIFVNAGQQCSVGSRLFLQEEIYDSFLSRFLEVAQRIRVGDPFDTNVHMGAISSQEQLDKIERYVAIGQKEGGRILCGGRRPADSSLKNGYFFEPTVFVDVKNKMQVCQDEIFGPVVTVLRFKDEAEILEVANDSKYGLVAGIWTNDLGRAHRLAKNVEAGLVWINTYRRHHWTLPYGGIKMSGYGRENGQETIHEYTRVKSVLIDTDPNRPEPYPSP